MNNITAKRICRELDEKFENIRLRRNVKFSDVYSDRKEMLDDLAKVYIPKNRVAPFGTFKGYEYIYSFAFYAQKGWTLSEKQMKQAERLATEIKKAASICDYKF